MNSTSKKILSSYLVEVSTSFSPEWRNFGTYTATSKADAIKQAREYNWRNGCLDRISDGRITFRALTA